MLLYIHNKNELVIFQQCIVLFLKPLQYNTSEACYLLQEKQLKKIRAKQKRLQAVLDGEDIQKLEAELLIEDDEGK